MKNIKKEVCKRIPKSKLEDNSVFEEIDLVVGDDIPPGAVPISGVAQEGNETVELCSTELIQEPTIRTAANESTLVQIPKKTKIKSSGDSVAAKKIKKGKATLLTSEEYRKELQQEKEAAAAKKAAAVAKKEAAAAKKEAAVKKKALKKYTKSEMEQLILQQQQMLMGAQAVLNSRMFAPQVNNNVSKGNAEPLPNPLLINQSITGQPLYAPMIAGNENIIPAIPEVPVISAPLNAIQQSPANLSQISSQPWPFLMS